MVFRFYCMALFHSQTRRHVINQFQYLIELKRFQDGTYLYKTKLSHIKPSFPKICKPIVVYRFYCMALFHSQTRGHVINQFHYLIELKRFQDGTYLYKTKFLSPRKISIFYGWVHNHLIMMGVWSVWCYSGITPSGLGRVIISSSLLLIL